MASTNKPLTHPVDIQAANWEKFKSKASGLFNRRDEYGSDKSGLSNLLEVLENEDGYVLSLPASTRLEYMGCYEGGLVEHSLRVMGTMGRLMSAYGIKDVSTDSVIFTALFHDIGKAGYLIPHQAKWEPYYLEQRSSWHREKLGQYYEVNPKLGHMSPGQLSLFALNSCGVQLTLEEWSAIADLKAADIKGDESIPGHNESKLSLLLKQAVRFVSLENKNKGVVELVGKEPTK